MDRILEKLYRESKERRVAVYLFVHGWRNNASFDKGNVKLFRDVLRQAAELERKRGDGQGRVFGIYVGWRGKSLAGPGAWEVLSFWGRKSRRSTCGEGSVRELFARLRQLKLSDTHNQRRQVDAAFVTGHSFGGLIVYTAISQMLMESAVRNDGGTVEPSVDLVVLINPAFEASRYEPLHRIATGRRYVRGHRPVFVAITADNDWATSMAFPFGRWLNGILRATNAGCEAANRRTMGHLDGYRTHELTSNPHDACNGMGWRF